MQDKNDPFEKLKNSAVPPASDTAQHNALANAMQAFEADQADESQKNARPAQGSGWRQRLRSIFNIPKRNWIMDMRVPIGATFAGLLLFPLAMQLYSSTSFTGPDQLPLPNVNVERAPEPLATIAPQEVREEALVDQSSSGNAATVPQQKLAPEVLGRARGVFSAEADMEVAPLSAPVPAPTVRNQWASGALQQQSGLEAIQLPYEPSPSGDRFAEFDEAPVFVTAENPVSTFSIDVDTASYAYVRRALEDGFLPPPSAVRVEEMINYFDYDYPAPDSAEVPFAQSVAVYPTPWNSDSKLLHIGIKGFTPEAGKDKPSNLVFLIDTSGSMNEADKLPLLKRSFALLLDQMDGDDTISIVTYAGSAGVVLEPTPASERDKILDALRDLTPGGSTAGAAGIEQAYRLAERVQNAESVNRVILATDGDFNVGIAEPDALKRFIESKRDNGVFLSVLGFGAGNYNDALMQALAQNGNGNAFYIDSFQEARKVLVEQLQGTLTTIAKDVKIQVEFNPMTVSEYRLVGYETRALNREDFNNDKVDAGDIGAGHTVTAIYEIIPVGAPGAVDPLRYGETVLVVEPAPEVSSDDEYAFLKLRYKRPDENVSQLITEPVYVGDAYATFAAAPTDFRFGAAVAAFGQKLRGGQNANDLSFAEIRALANAARGEDRHGYRTAFLSLVDNADSLSGDR